MHADAGDDHCAASDQGGVVKPRPVIRCECGTLIRQKPYAPGKVGIPILVPVNLDGSRHFCFQPRPCFKAAFD